MEGQHPIGGDKAAARSPPQAGPGDQNIRFSASALCFYRVIVCLEEGENQHQFHCPLTQIPLKARPETRPEPARCCQKELLLNPYCVDRLETRRKPDAGGETDSQVNSKGQGSDGEMMDEGDGLL
ncbi:hypothetical protein EYF80_029195 [Liparis tanakae]|uniref:Uncharacterized protein n=1 Tax=Liparis tanakae TaxID=230148 RepID=A0A4Z2H6Z7_9TELE|nr:hypothetical protein EYF80_029195 [Liparis tanakae]